MSFEKRSVVNTSRRTALVVEGGGLRGAYAVGVLKVLHEYGGASQFDAIYAASSGVFAATYFAAGQVEEMESTWRDLVHGSQLVNYWNILKRRPILGLDYLIDLFKGPVRLDLNKVYRCKPEIKYVVTESATGLPHYLDAKRPEIFDIMKASSALPCVYPRKIIIDGKRFEDSSHSDPIPIKKAISDGYSEIVVILTQPRGYIKQPRSKLVGMICLRRSPATMRAFLNSHRIYNESLQVIEESSSQGPTITAIRPEYVGISRLTRDRNKIIEAIEQGKADATKMFEEIVFRRHQYSEERHDSTD